VIGGERCPIVDTWWQTETGAHMIAPLPGVKSTKPGSSQAPIPGISVDVVDDTGENPAGPEGGLLVIRQPWAGDAARNLERPRALQGHLLVAVPEHVLRRGTVPVATPTATSGSSDASTMS
jgi:acyl-coenzyme A synthetase/AMP-(fatty) acid ligase